MPDLIVTETLIRQDEDGRYCLNDLHRASGSAKRHAPNEWLRLKATKALASELTGDSRLAAIASAHGGANPGTYVARELVYAYATCGSMCEAQICASVQKGGTDGSSTYVARELQPLVASYRDLNEGFQRDR